MATNNAANRPRLTANGQLIIGSTGAVPAANTLTAGTNITVTNGAGTITIAASGGTAALTFIASATASASATVDFANNLNSTYDNYLVVMENVLPASNAITWQLRFGTGGTPTYQTTSYSGSGRTYAGGTTYASGTSALDINVSSRVSNVANRTGGGMIYFFNANNATNDKTIVTNIQNWDSSGLYDGSSYFAGRWQNATVITSLRFFYSSGNVTSGIFKLYGISN